MATVAGQYTRRGGTRLSVQGGPLLVLTRGPSYLPCKAAFFSEPPPFFISGEKGGVPRDKGVGEKEKECIADFILVGTPGS